MQRGSERSGKVGRLRGMRGTSVGRPRPEPLVKQTFYTSISPCGTRLARSRGCSSRLRSLRRSDPTDAHAARHGVCPVFRHEPGRSCAMCYTCGCKLPYEDHGEPRNIVEQALVNAGKTKEIKNAGRVKAKENMFELIREQQRRGELEEPRANYAEETTKKG